MHTQRTIPRACETCGAPFLAWRTSTKSPTHGRFCSRQCANVVRKSQTNTRFRASLLAMKDVAGCWESPFGYPNDDGHVRIGSRSNRVFAHKLAWVLGGGQDIPTDGKILHTCDNPPCVRNDTVGIYVVDGIECPRIGHLFLGTVAINNTDKAGKGRSTKGEDYWSARLTEDGVRDIRAAVQAGSTLTSQADKYGVSINCISALIKRKTWRHVE